MRQHPASLLIATSLMAIAGSASGLAQSPPSTDDHSLVWSDRDLSLRSGALTQTPDTETSLQLPRVDFPASSFEGRQGQVLMCEPGQWAFIEAGPANYAQAGKQQIQPR
jgi:hypothetical protein